MTPQQYISRIRNKRKQEYARKYLAWYDKARLNRDTCPEPDGLGVMAAQAVRMRIHQLVHA
jgi:hypothetical protein